jgi:alpha-tubulin suppressor-like RCC1 family protein
LKNDGTVWATGENGYGQLGDGTQYNQRTVPVQVIGMTGVTAIAAGGHHTLFLKNDNTVWATGYNSSGQLGDGTLTTRTTAFKIPGLTGITAISAGDFHSLFLKNDNTVWSVGDNGSGQLGVGSVVDKTTPVQVQGLCSGPLATIDVEESDRLSIYPNPCEDELTIKVADFASTTLSLYTIQGQLLYELNLDQTITTLSIPTLQNGLYLVQVKSPKGTLVKKIVKR